MMSDQKSPIQFRSGRFRSTAKMAEIFRIGRVHRAEKSAPSSVLGEGAPLRRQTAMPAVLAPICGRLVVPHVAEKNRHDLQKGSSINACDNPTGWGGVWRP